jgi:hypothetical protein
VVHAANHRQLPWTRRQPRPPLDEGQLHQLRAAA